MALLLNVGDTVSRSYSYTQPSPSHPIQPQSCGERTGNLYDGALLSGFYRNASFDLDTSVGTVYKSIKVYLLAGTYTVSFEHNVNIVRQILDSIYSENIASNIDSYTFTTTTDTYFGISFRLSQSSSASWDNSNIMFNTGSQPLPYEPYGIKIPILNNSQTTNIYLGSVQSTRQIKKLVFDGTENWTYSASGDKKRVFVRGFDRAEIALALCSHFDNTDFVSYPDSGKFAVNATSTNQSMIFGITDMPITSATDWTTYLAQQYAAGTPVTVWYVLATSTTGVVNEPLMKIGDYADEVSGVSIPVTAGGDTLSVGTTVQPSEVTVNYKGWHPVADVHVYPDSSWMPTSWEEFRKAVRSGKAQSLYPVGTKLYENWGDETSNAWIVVDYPNDNRYIDSDLAQQGYTNRVMLMEEKLNYSLTYDTKDAWMYVETALLAGSYRFTIPNYDVAHGGNKTYIFTSTADVPVGGQFTLTWSTVSNPSAVQGYSSQTSETALFDVSISEWDGTTACTDLGTIKKTISDPDSQYGKMNSIERARMSSDNYYQSGIRQWLNASEAANWWTPSNVFDRPYANRTTAGRLSTLNSDMKAVLATPSINCITNNIFESPSLDATTFSLNTVYTVRDKLFLPSHTEVNLSQSPSVNTAFEYYVDAQNNDRIKYRSNGTAYTWWTRVPTSIEAQRVNIVSTNGTWSNPSGGSTNGVAACCVIQ